MDIIKKSSTKYSKSSSIYVLLSELPNRVSDAYEEILSTSEVPKTARKLL